MSLLAPADVGPMWGARPAFQAPVAQPEPSPSLVEGKWFWLTVAEINPIDIETLVGSGTQPNELSYSGPNFSGTRTYQAMAIRLRRIDFAEAKVAASREGGRLLEGQAIPSFMEKFPRHKDKGDLPVFFGGAKFSRGDQEFILYLGLGNNGLWVVNLLRIDVDVRYKMDRLWMIVKNDDPPEHPRTFSFRRLFGLLRPKP